MKINRRNFLKSAGGVLVAAPFVINDGFNIDPDYEPFRNKIKFT